MKPKIVFLAAIVSALLMSSCGAFRYAHSSRFVDLPPQLGMEKGAFVAAYGAPFRQNVFYDENNALNEELIYRETVLHGDATFLGNGDWRAINSIFLFKNGKLVSQFQEDDREYQIQLEREQDRRLMEERINAEKQRAAAERERAEAEKERVKAEKEAKEAAEKRK